MKSTKRPPILSTSAAALLALLVAGSTAKATVLTWTGAVNNYWGTNGNWNPPLTPFTDPGVSDLIFTGSRNTSSVNNQQLDFINSITFDSHASKFTLSGFGFTMQGGSSITNNSSNLQVLNFSNVGGAGGIQFSNGDLLSFTFKPGATTINAAKSDILIFNDMSFLSVVPNGKVPLVVTGANNVTMVGSLFQLAGAVGSLEKDGTGTLRMMGKNFWSGNTVVNGGRLQVDGSITSPNTFVNPGGTLGGLGYIQGNVYNYGGNVNPGDTFGNMQVGTFTIKGNYAQTNGGALTIDVNGAKAGQFSQLAVTQRATISGDLRLDNRGGSVLLKPGQKVDVLVANGGVDGTFGKVSNVSDTLVTTKVVYSPNAVAIEGLSDPFGNIKGLTHNQNAVAQGLDKIAFRNTQPKLISYILNQPVSNLPGAYDRLAPEELTSVYTIGVALANVQTANLQRRTEDIRAGSHGFSASGFAAAGSGPLYSGGVTGPNGNDGKESKEVKNVVPAEDRWGLFITGVGEWVNVSGDNNARGYDITTGGFTVGADYKVTPNFAVGLSAGYAGTDTDLTHGSRVWVNGGKLGLYATYFTGGGFYIDTAVTGGYNSYDTRRSALQGTARGDTDGGELNALFATGYDVKAGNFTFGPTASFQYTYLGIGSFDEHGSLAPLSFRSQHQDSLRTAFGMRASYDWKVGGVVIRPELRAAWQHEFGDDRYAIDASFSGGNGNLFTVDGPRLGRDSLLLGAGFAILWSERISTYVYYDGELGRENYEAQNVSGGVRVSF